jgi:hypothetical protein
MFWSLNRFLGFPARVFVTHEIGIRNLINLYSGHRPCFISVARYKGVDEEFMCYFPFDFDSMLSLRIPYSDTNKLLNFFISKDIPHKVVGSGGKGFHCYFEFEETQATNEVYNKIYSIQEALRKKLNLNSADKPLFGKQHLMIRIPTTPYVGKKEVNGKKTFVRGETFCRYLKDEEFQSGLNHIIELMHERGEMPIKNKSPPPLDDIIDKIPEYKYKEKGDCSITIDLETGGVLEPTIESIGLPCLMEIASSSEPNHHERIELVAWLKLLGYRDIAILGFMKKLHWKNFNSAKTALQLRSINPRFPKCKMLREKNNGFCDKCTLINKTGEYNDNN